MNTQVPAYQRLLSGLVLTMHDMDPAPGDDPQDIDVASWATNGGGPLSERQVARALLTFPGWDLLEHGPAIDVATTARKVVTWAHNRIITQLDDGWTEPMLTSHLAVMTDHATGIRFGLSFVPREERI